MTTTKITEQLLNDAVIECEKILPLWQELNTQNTQPVDCIQAVKKYLKDGTNAKKHLFEYQKKTAYVGCSSLTEHYIYSATFYLGRAVTSHIAALYFKEHNFPKWYENKAEAERQKYLIWCFNHIKGAKTDITNIND